MIVRTALKALLAVLLAAPVGYWLFSDTVAYYARDAADRPLRISFWGPYEEFEMWKTMLADFRAAHPDIRVRLEYINSQYEAKIQRLLVARDAPDVILYQDEPYPRLVEDGKFLDLTELIRRDRAELGIPDWNLPPEVPLPGEAAPAGGDRFRHALQQRWWATAVEYFGRPQRDPDGPTRWHQYGLPIWGGCNLLYYNKECFRKAAISVQSHDGPTGIRKTPGGNERFADTWLLDDERWTLTDFIEVCKRLTFRDERTGRVEQYGFSLGWFGYWLPFLQTVGADFLYRDPANPELHKRRTTFYGPEMEAGLALWQDMLWKHRVAPTPAEMGSLNDDTGFYTGRIAIRNTGPWGMPFLNAVSAGDPLRAYDLLHIPRNDLTAKRRGERSTRITWDALSICADSKKKEQAWTLVKFLVTPQAQRVVARVQRSIPASRPPEEVVRRAIMAGRVTAEDLRYPAVYFMTLNPQVSVRKFVVTANDYAEVQPVTLHWTLMGRAWKDAADGLIMDDPGKRLTPRQAIGKFYAADGNGKQLWQVMPPADEETALRYRAEYEGRGGK